jgi:HEPN domain-containing protein
MKNTDTAREWLKRARGSLAQAQAGMENGDILIEDRCFHAQQAVEKSLKGLCCHWDLPFPKTHDIGRLIDILAKRLPEFPEDLLEAKILTDYAVTTRYPGEYSPVSDDDLRKALAIARKVLETMRPFHTVAVPHQDILSGRLTMDVFSADLWEVTRNAQSSSADSKGALPSASSSMVPSWSSAIPLPVV